LAYIARNENSNALKDFLAALKLDNPGQQRESELYYNCGIAYFGLKKYDYSLESLNRAIELYQHPDIYLALNKTLFEMGKYKEAAERLTEAIDFDPNYRGLYILYNERGKAYSKLKMEKEALKDYEEANRLFRQAQEQNNNAAR
jgi:tetratricopeptide (TPR) repeat protein